MWYSIIANIIWLNVIRITVPGDSSLLGWDAVTLGEWFLVFWRNIYCVHSQGSSRPRIIGQQVKNDPEMKTVGVHSMHCKHGQVCFWPTGRSLRQEWRNITNTSSLGVPTGWLMQIQPLPSNLTQEHQILHQSWLHLPSFQVSNGDGTVSQPYPNCIPTVSQWYPNHIPTISQTYPIRVPTVSQLYPNRIPTVSQHHEQGEL